MSTDKNAIQAVQQGERDRFAELVYRHQKTVYGIAWSHLGDPDTCEDAAQETFIKAYRYLGALRDPDKFPSWLARIARNVCTTILRKRQRELKNLNRWQMEQPAPTTEETSSDEEENLSELLGNTMAELQPDHRECLTLFYLEGKSVRETAEVLGVSESTVKTRLHRARKTLRSGLDKRIESQLENLSPNKNFTASVMVILPQTSILGILGLGGGASWIGKTMTGVGKWISGFQFTLWVTLGQIAIIYFFTDWMSQLISRNFTDQPENKFRKRLVRQELKMLCLLMISALVLTHFTISIFNFQAFFLLLSFYCFMGVYNNLLLLRVNRRSYTLGQFLTIFLFCITSGLIGIFHFHLTIFLAALVLVNIFLFYTNRNMPLRQDYNLFLRESQGYLGAPEQEIHLCKPLTHTEQKAFVRFLGDKWLVRGYTIKDNVLMMSLPPVQAGLANTFLMTTVGTSVVKVHSNGKCRAILSPSDLRSLETMQNITVNQEEIQESISQVMGNCLYYFLNGKSEQANQLLSTIPENEIIKTSYSKTKAYWMGHGIALFCSIILLAFSVYSGIW